jgi:genome maintenance exonuclease 1
MNHNNKFIYPKSQREIINGKRHYNVKAQKLPSVTTILAATQSPEKQASLAAWRERVGNEEATRIVDDAGTRGTAMHKILEEYIQGQGYLDLTPAGLNAHNMAIKIIENGLSNVTEYYGLEATLYYPSLYAGATDMIGVHKGQDAIIDFKTTNKVKKKEWIQDYCLQLAGYVMAHNFIYRTSITKGVIMMCSKDLYYQEFVIEGLELQKYKHEFLKKVGQYYKMQDEKALDNNAV